MTKFLLSSEYIEWRLVVFTSIFVPLQIVVVALRVYARRLAISHRFGLEDTLILLALALQVILSAVIVATVSHAGVGHHLAYLKIHDAAKLLAWGKHLFTTTVIYGISINIPKLAILVLYNDVFPMRTVRIIVWALAGILVAQTVSNVIVLLAACQPFEANYNPTIPGAKCIDKELLFAWASLPNIVTDVAMLIVPLPIVWKLHNTRRIRIALTFTFLVGSSGLLTSILRFHAFLRTDSFQDATWDAVELFSWTITEPGIYLTSACLLSYKPLLDRAAKSRLITAIIGGNNHSRVAGYGNGQDVECMDGSGSIPLRKTTKSGNGFTELHDEESIGAATVNPTSTDIDRV